MKLGIYYRDYEAFGGVPREFQHYAMALAKQGVDVIVYTHSGENKVDIEGVIVKDFKSTGMLKKFLVPKELLKQMHQDSKELDILMIVGGFIMHNWSVYLKAMEVNLPYVLSPLGVLVPKVIARSPFRKKIFYNLFLKKIISNASVIHCHSEFEIECMRKHTGKPTIKTHYGTFGEDLPGSIDRTLLRKKFDIKDNEIILLFLGRLDMAGKGLSELIYGFRNALLKNKKIKLILVGPDNDNDREKLTDIITNEKLEEVVLLSDPIYGDDKFSALASADVFISPSHYDLWPRSIREALLVSCPVIISKETHAADLIEKYSAGLVCQVDVDDIADKILKLVADRDKLSAIRINAHQAAIEGLSWGKQALVLKDGLEKVLSNYDCS